MVTKLRCPKDLTILVTFDDSLPDKTAMSFGPNGGLMQPRPNANDPKLFDLHFICPKCGSEVPSGRSMPKEVPNAS